MWGKDKLIKKRMGQNSMRDEVKSWKEKVDLRLGGKVQILIKAERGKRWIL